jgi:hypothetical protein
LTQDIEPVVRTKKEQLAFLRNISKQRATNLLPKVWTYLGRLMDDETAPHGARLSATNMILDRALGKSTEHKEVDVRVNINTQHLDALKVINAAFRADAEAQVLEVLDGDVVEEDSDPSVTPAIEDKS